MKTHFLRQQADRCSRVNLTLRHYLQCHGGTNVPLYGEIYQRESRSGPRLHLKAKRLRYGRAEEGRGAHIVFEVLIMHGLADYHQRRGGCLVNDSCLTEWSGDHISLSLDMMDRSYSSQKQPCLTLLAWTPHLFVTRYLQLTNLTTHLSIRQKLRSTLENAYNQSPDSD